MTIYYKVVCLVPIGKTFVVEPKFVSSFISHDRARIEYKPYQWVEPINGNGPLAVFDTLENAKDYMRSLWGDIIFECEIERSAATYLKIKKENLDTFYISHRFQSEVTDRRIRVNSLPEGTVLARKVFITKPLVINSVYIPPLVERKIKDVIATAEKEHKKRNETQEISNKVPSEK